MMYTIVPPEVINGEEITQAQYARRNGVPVELRKGPDGNLAVSRYITTDLSVYLGKIL